MAKNPFHIDDKVYVYPVGWGYVNHISPEVCKVDFDKGTIDLVDWRLVSFTEYDPIKGGLSHNRPKVCRIAGMIDPLTDEQKREIKELVKQLAEDMDRHVGCYHGPYGNYPSPDSHGDANAKGCFNVGDVKFRVEGHDLLAKLKNVGRWGDDPRKDIIPAEIAQRNLKALKYIKKLLKEDYNVVDDFISVEELGDEVQVSLTFKKG